MAAAREKPTFVDWVVVALSPILVMLMVGSLSFFLVEVLYSGQYTTRLISTLFFFVIAAVLIARISIEQGSSKAWLYGIGLGLATFLAFQALVEYPSKSIQAISPMINLFLMAVVWWSANKLTWDCTHLDEDRKSSGRGVLAAAGLDGPAAANAAQLRAREKQGETDDDDASARIEAKKRKKDPDGIAGWMARWNRYREYQKKKPHTPGTWIVYFSLAAFPLFGLGQSLIPADDAARRRATFLQMAVYVGSGLMLLVTTSLLGLRKYLRERNAKIPAKMTVGWLGIGAATVAIFLAIGAALPRPHSETPLIDLPTAGKKDRNASKFAQKTDDGAAGKGEGKAGNKNEAGKDAKASGKNGEKGGNAGEKGDGGGKGKDRGGQNKADGKDGKQGEGKQNDQGTQGEQKARNKKADGDQQEQGNQGEQKRDNQDNQADGGQDANKADGQADERDKSSNDGSSSRETMSKVFESIGGFLKWVTWFVIAVLVIVGIAIFFLKYLAPFTQWAKNLLDWLRGLFARKARESSGRNSDDEPETEEEAYRPPPFAEFPNPFDDGSAKRMTLPQLIEYSFAAYESWAWDHELGRKPDETPNEFAMRIGESCEELDADGCKLANLYVRSLYSKSELPAVEAVKTLQSFWRSVENAEPARA